MKPLILVYTIWLGKENGFMTKARVSKISS